MVAGVAVDAQEAVGEHATLEVRAHLALDESSDGGALPSRSREERDQFRADDIAKNGPRNVVAVCSPDHESADGSAHGVTHQNGEAGEHRDSKPRLRRRTPRRGLAVTLGDGAGSAADLWLRITSRGKPNGAHPFENSQKFIPWGDAQGSILGHEGDPFLK